MSRSLLRANAQTAEPVTSPGDGPHSLEVAGGSDRKACFDHIHAERGKSRATSIFSAMTMLAPGDCSPSRKVVSNIRTRLSSGGVAGGPASTSWVVSGS